MSVYHLLMLSSLCGCLAEQFPLQISPVIGNSSCPSDLEREDIQHFFQNQVRSLVEDNVNCPCGTPGEWTRIAHLDLSDPSQQCPDNWELVTSPVRGCSGPIPRVSTCDSASFPAAEKSYSRVCGRVNAYQRGAPDAFDPSIRGSQTIENNYLDGISLTHGAAGSRQHVWSFPIALSEDSPLVQDRPHFICSCTTDNPWPFDVPSFVGTDYFCATGNPGPEIASSVYADDILFDGEGCGSSNACCEFNHPPWFCTTLPQPTMDDLEMRLCRNELSTTEDGIVSLVEIYVQ